MNQLIANLLGPPCLVLILLASLAQSGSPPEPKPAVAWTIGAPIVSYYAGPPMTDAVAKQMFDGGFNVVWCGEKDLDLVSRSGLRGMLHDPLLAPATLENPAQQEKLDALIQRVRGHKALYAYYLTDEPAAAAFPALGKLVGHLRQRDPERLAYLNLFPTYATNEQLGTKSEKIPAYKEYLKQYVEITKPALLSYDNYQFYKAGDGKEYFLNLALVRRASIDAKIPFLNIVQASAWQPAVRVPTADETRYLVYTTLAYGASGISYYVYYAAGHEGGIVNAEGKPMPIYEALKTLNREFVSIATELQPLKSLAVYHTSLNEEGCEPLPANAPFRPEPATATPEGARGLVLGYFGAAEEPTHVLVANLDYKAEARVNLVGPGDLDLFDAATGKWAAAAGKRAELRLSPGGGKLVRRQQ